MKRFILGVIAYFIFAGSAFAAAPEVMTYQGRLKENGLPVTGNRNITLSLCEGPELPDSCYPEAAAQSVYVSTGLFKSTFTLPSGVDLSAPNDWYLRVTVGTTDLWPREKFTAVPYALYSSSAAYASSAVLRTGDTMTGALLVSGSSLTIVASDAIPASLWVSSSAVTPHLFVSTGGRVGLGTDSPDHPLHIVSIGEQVALKVEGYDTSWDTIYIDSRGGGNPGYGYLQGGLLKAMTSVDGSENLNLEVNGVNRLTIRPDGRVGLNTVTPSYLLHISTTAGETGPIMAVSTGSSNVFWVDGTAAHALKFIGDGSGLTGVTGASGTDSTKVLKTGDTMTGPLHILSDDLLNDTSDFITTGIVISTGGAIRTTGIGHGTAAGNTRGLGAVDLQTFRTLATEVAGGDYAVLSGGVRNRAAGMYSVLSGGYTNSSAGTYSAVGGGQQNSASVSHSVVAGGQLNIAGGQASIVGGGVSNAASGDQSVVAGGVSNRAGAQYAFVGGGNDNRATGMYSVVPGGYNNTAEGNYSFAAGGRSSSTAQGAFTWQDSGGAALNLINNVTDRTVFKSRGGFMVTGSTNASGLGALVDRGVIITGNGLVGISTYVPQAALDIVSTGDTVNDYAQIWRDSGGVTRASVTATGVFFGDGSGLTNLPAASIGGIIPVSQGGSGADLSATGGANQFVRQNSAGGVFSVSVIADADVPDNITISGTDNVTWESVSKTGSSLADLAARNIADLTGTLGVASGGTGATDAAAARTSLGAAGLGANTFTGVQTYGSGSSLAAAVNQPGVRVSTAIFVGSGADISTITPAGFFGSSISVTGAIGISTSVPGAQLAIEYAWGTNTPIMTVWEPSAGYTFGLDKNAHLYYGPSLNYGAGSIVNFGGNQTQVGAGAVMFHIYPQSVAPGGYLLKAQDGADMRLAIDSEGRVGVGTASPVSRFHVAGGSVTISGTEAALLFDDEARKIAPTTDSTVGAGIYFSTNVYIVGFSSAAKYYGDGSGLSNIAGDSLGNHIATTTLQMGAYGINSSSAVNAAYYQINGSTVMAILPGIGSMGIGVNAGASETASYNIYIGSGSGRNHSTGTNNTMLGYLSGSSNLSGSGNTFIGSFAGLDNVSGGHNVVIGYLQDTSAGNSSYELNIGGVLFGKLSDKTIGISTRAPQAALDIVSTGTLTTQMAQLWRDSTGLIVGSMSVTGSMQAVRFVGDGSALTGLPGDGLGNHIATTTLQMGAYGVNSSSAVSAAYYQVKGSTVLAARANGSFFLGYNAGADSTGAENTFLGFEAGRYHESSGGNTFLGFKSGWDNRGAANTFVGGNTGLAYGDGVQNTFVGYNTGKNNTSGADNTFVGSEAGIDNSVGSNNSFVGVWSGYYNLTGNDNAVLGHSALNNNASGSANVVLGVESGYGVSGNSFSSSTLVGYRAGYALTTGSDNILMGFRAGDNLGTGARNIIIGYDLDATAPTISDEIRIGSIIYGNMATGGVALGAANTLPAAALDVKSTGTASNIYAQIWRDDTGVVRASVTSEGRFFGDGSGLSGITVSDNTKLPLAGGALSGQLTIDGATLDIATLTVKGSAFSVGGGTFTVQDGRVSVGSASSVPALLEVREVQFAQNSYLLALGTGTVSHMVLVSTAGSVGIGVQPSTESVFHAHMSYGFTAGGEEVALGLQASAYGYGNGDADDAVAGADFHAAVNSDANLGYLAGLHTQMTRDYGSGAGTLGNAMGLYIDDFKNQSTGLGAVTNTYGVYIGSLTAGVQTNAPYAIYSEDANARTYFAGNVGISSTTPMAALVVSSAAGSSGAMLIVSTGSSIVFGVKGNGEVYTAGKFIGDGSMLTNLAGDGLGNHIATMTLQMGGFGVNSSSSVSAAYYQINGSTVLALLPGAGSLALGAYDEGRTNNTGIGNNFLGYNSGVMNTGRDNNFLGYYSGYGSQQASANNYMGYRAGMYNQSGSANVLLGHQAGYGQNANSFSSNTAVGYQAGYSMLEGGSDNIFIGWQAGYNVTTGTRNIIIGYDQRAFDPTDNNVMNIGGVLFGDLHEGAIGINSARIPGGIQPQAALDIISTATASDVYAQIWRDGAAVVRASVTSEGVFYGNGSGLTNLNAVARTGDTMSGPLLLPTGSGATPSLGFSGNPDTGLFSPGSGQIAFTTGGVEKLRLTAAGQLGLGMTLPLEALDIAGRVKISTSAGGDPQMDGLFSHGTSGMVFQSGGFTYMNVASGGGQVGIGNSVFSGAGSPKLQVTGSMSVGMNFNSKTPPSNSLIVEGPVGIGKGDPEYALDVSTITDAHSYVARLGAAGVLISTGGAIQTTGLGHGTAVGDPRGNGAVDLQTYRAVNTEVASGGYATVSGGRSNTASNYYAAVSGGYYNVVSGSNSFIGGGAYNIAKGTSAVVAGGEINSATAYYSFVGGGNMNSANGLLSAVVGGTYQVANGEKSFIGGGGYNTVDAQYGVIAGGNGNKMQNDALASFIGSGLENIVSASSYYSSVVGGSSNTVSASYAFIGGGGPVNPGKQGNRVLSDYSAVVGGSSNTADANSWMSFIGGGSENKVSGQQSAVVGGWMNIAGAGASSYAGVVAGWGNRATGDSAFIGAGGGNRADGSYSAVAGGQSNVAGGSGASVPGGYYNTASGSYSFAAGYRSSSTLPGTFTWSDSQGVVTENAVQDQVRFKARGGFLVSGSTNTADAGFFVSGAGAVTMGNGLFISSQGAVQTTGLGTNNVGPDPRDATAVDLQNHRENSTQIASAYLSVISGGGSNRAGNRATVGGGQYNIASGMGSVVAGGYTNTAAGAYSTVPGGLNNSASSDYSFAAGRRAQSAAVGAFTWGDSRDVPLFNNVQDRAWFKASGGFLVTASTQPHVDGKLQAGRIAGSSFTVIVNGDLALGDGTPAYNKPVTIWLMNDSGSPRSRGDIVVISQINDNAFDCVSFASTKTVVGVVYDESIATAGVGRVAIHGVVDVKTNVSASRGHSVVTSPTACQADSVPAGSVPPGAAIGKWMAAGGGGGALRKAVLISH